MWKDTTSYSQGRERIPTTWSMDRGGLHITVTSADPPGTETIIFPCHKCREGKGPKVQYLDTNGRPIQTEA